MALNPALPLFSFLPDWGPGISERLAFRTDAMRARAGQEQTRGLLAAPRRLLEFALGLEGVERQRFNARLWATRKGEWYLPIWTDGLQLAAELTAGATTFTLEAADRDFSDGGVIMFLGADSGVAEVFDLSLVGDSATIGEASARTWPAGTLVFPARRARIDENFSADAFTGGAGMGRIRFLLTEPSDWPAVAPATTYRGFPVLTTRPHTGRDPGTEFTVLADTVDDGLAPAAVFDYVGSPLALQQHDFWLSGREAIAELRSLLYYLNGKRKSIWVPTWLSDLSIAASMGSGSTALRVEHCGYTANLFEANNRRDIRIELQSGAVYYRRVSGSSVVSDSLEELTLDSALGVAVTVADVKQISFLALSRSDADLFQLEWWSGEMCEVATAWRGRKHDE